MKTKGKIKKERSYTEISTRVLLPPQPHYLLRFRYEESFPTTSYRSEIAPNRTKTPKTLKNLNNQYINETLKVCSNIPETQHDNCSFQTGAHFNTSDQVSVHNPTNVT